ncbi:MAG: DMT family transporter [Mycetocola sp.]
MIFGIALALASAAFMTVGNLLQSSGVHRAQEHATGPKDATSRMLHNRYWLAGGGALILAMLVQLGSLSFAPLIVVQPIGVAALVFSVVLTSISSKTRPSAAIVRSIVLCVIGVGGFVTVASIVSTQHPITSGQLIAVLSTLAVLLTVTVIVELTGRGRRTPPLVWVLLGGVYSAFVATLGKTVILRVKAIIEARAFHFDEADVLTLISLVGIGVAGGLSVVFVQRAHLDNKPEVVVAGLTVIDPTVAVVLGIVVLREASNAPLWSVFAFIIAGAIAVVGVISLARAEQPNASTAVPLSGGATGESQGDNGVK